MAEREETAGRVLRITNLLLQLRVLGLGLLQDGDVGIGVFPEIEEALMLCLGFGFRRIALTEPTRATRRPN